MAKKPAIEDIEDDEDIRLDTSELKALFKIARSRTLLFAYCPGGADEDIFLINRRRRPERLAKEARRESSGTKVAYGTMTVRGKILEITCDREVPSMSRRLAKYLREKRVPMEIRIMNDDKDGKGGE